MALPVHDGGRLQWAENSCDRSCAGEKGGAGENLRTLFARRRKIAQSSCAFGGNIFVRNPHWMTVVHTIVCTIKQCVFLLLRTSSAEFDGHVARQML